MTTLLALGTVCPDLWLNGKFKKAGPVASWVCVKSWAYSNYYGTDGFISDAAVLELTVGLPKAKTIPGTLVKEVLWEEREGGYYIHGFLDFTSPNRQRNRSAQWWRDLRENRSKAGKWKRG